MTEEPFLLRQRVIKEMDLSARRYIITVDGGGGYGGGSAEDQRQRVEDFERNEAEWNKPVAMPSLGWTALAIMLGFSAGLWVVAGLFVLQHWDSISAWFWRVI